MKVMKFNYKDGGGFMGVDKDMLVKYAAPIPGTIGMVRVRVIDERSRHVGEEFSAYVSELTPMATCPMSREHGHV